MNRRLTLALAHGALLALAAATPAAAQSRLDFQLVNRTGYEINEVYIGPTTSRSWGRDVLGQGTLVTGRSVDIRFNAGSQTCQWDIKVVYTDGDESEFRNTNLCSISRITLFWNRQAGTTRAVTE